MKYFLHIERKYIVPACKFDDGTMISEYEATDKMTFDFDTIGEAFIALEKLSCAGNYEEFDVWITNKAEASYV